MATENEESRPPAAGARPRGRPRGRTAQGDKTRDALFDAAIELMNRDGFEATTLRKVAAQAGVSHAVVYRYFPSKASLVTALYDRLSAQFSNGLALEPGPWKRRAVDAMRASIATLGPHRPALRSAVGVLVSPTDEGLFADATRPARLRVRGAFEGAVVGAKDAPRGPRAAVLGRALDMAHLGVVLFWLLDRSDRQRATEALLGVFEKALPLVRGLLKLPGAWKLLEQLDRIVDDGLLASAES